METEILFPDQVAIAAAHLREGGLVAFPTETVYGLGASIAHAAACQAIYEVKGRPQDNPLIVHAETVHQALALFDPKVVSDHLLALAHAFWPGPLTIVALAQAPKLQLYPEGLKNWETGKEAASDFRSGVSGRALEHAANEDEKSEAKPTQPGTNFSITKGIPTIAVRVPSHPLARRLIRLCGSPIAAPSANRSGRPSPTCALDVLSELGGKIRYIIDGGDTELGIESTIVSFVGQTPVVLRPGTISAEAIEQKTGLHMEFMQNKTSLVAPGMKYRHYAPEVPIEIVYTRAPFEKGALVLARLPKPGERLLSEKTLYREFRQAEEMQASKIVVYCDETTQAKQGLMNRLLKAAGSLPGSVDEA
ncbi:MAG: hypothetical protein RL235_701 [Chlamydiota bacterium]|jgi:L-threonylcarbamoyladenylate synthase